MTDVVTPLTPSTGTLDLVSVHHDGQVHRDNYRVLYAVVVHDREGVSLTNCDRCGVIAFNPDGTVREFFRSDTHHPNTALADAIAEEEIRRARAEKAAIAARMARVPALPGAIALTCRAHEYAQHWSAREGGCCPVCGQEGVPLVIPARVERTKSGDGLWITAEGSVRWVLEALVPIVTPETVKVMDGQRALYTGPIKAAELRARLQEIGWFARDVMKVVAPGKTAKKTGLRMVKGGAQ